MERRPDLSAHRSRLPGRAVTLWRVSSAMAWSPFIAVAVVIAIVVPGIPSPLRIAVVAAPVVLALVSIVFVQPARHRTWWFAITDEQLDLERGWLVATHTVVPMTRVQHVDLQQGPLARRLHLAQLQVHTAAGSVTIPALDRAEGEAIRQRIADLARIADDL